MRAAHPLHSSVRAQHRAAHRIEAQRSAAFVGPPASTACAKKTARWEFSNVRPSLLLLTPKID